VDELYCPFTTFRMLTLLAPRLGIEYEPSSLNDVEGSLSASVRPGQRAPDVLLRKNGLPHPLRLNQVTKNSGKFQGLVFTGDVPKTRPVLKSMRTQFNKHAPRLQHAVSFVTIVRGHDIAFEEYLGVEPFGNAYWDMDHSAHTRYGTSPESGDIIVLRPDGIVGFIASLDKFGAVVEYLERHVVPRGVGRPGINGVNGHVGELINLDENNLYYQQAKVQAREQGLPEGTESGAISAH